MRFTMSRPKTFRDYVARLKSCKFTQFEIGERLGISQPLISRICLGQVHLSAQVAQHISKRTGVPLAALLSQAPRPVVGMDNGVLTMRTRAAYRRPGRPPVSPPADAESIS